MCMFIIPITLGYCRRFRLVSFRDNDVWADDDVSSKSGSVEQKSVQTLLSKNLPNHERQAALAARKLGEGVLDGMEAVTLGLAKRGVVKTYVMIEGCPKELGCTVVLRGASRPALKQVKRVLRFLINCSYNMKLETSYILERCCRLPSSYEIPSTPCCSSSLCVDFGKPPNNRKARPWNGGKNVPAQRSLSGKITPLDHQAILITSVWMTDKTQCCPAEVKGICYYSMQDVSLGQFLRDSCFNLSLKCQNPSCKKSVIDHSLSFIHNDGLINISVERMDNVSGNFLSTFFVIHFCYVLNLTYTHFFSCSLSQRLASRNSRRILILPLHQKWRHLKIMSQLPHGHIVKSATKL